MVLRREKWILKQLWHVCGKRPLRPPKIVKNIATCSTHISKDSRSMFARQPDIWFYIENKVVKQD